MQPVCSCICHKPFYEVKATEKLKIKFKKVGQNRAIDDCSCFCDMPKLERCYQYVMPQQNIAPANVQKRTINTKPIKKILISDNTPSVPAIKPENSHQEHPI